MKTYMVTVKVTVPDEVDAVMVQDYFDDALANHGERVEEDNGYDWPADKGYVGNARAALQ